MGEEEWEEGVHLGVGGRQDHLLGPPGAWVVTPCTEALHSVSSDPILDRQEDTLRLPARWGLPEAPCQVRYHSRYRQGGPGDKLGGTGDSALA